MMMVVDKADLGSSRALENHAVLVMYALDDAITNMDDAEYLIDMLVTTGKSHRRFDNFSASIFWVRVNDVWQLESFPSLSFIAI